MLPRTLEPEVMDSAQEAADYDAMDHSEVNRRFVEDLLAVWMPALEEGRDSEPLRVLDVGTGTGLIPIELLRHCSTLVATTPALSNLSAIGIDLADSMLELGRQHVISAGLESQLELHRIDAKQLPWEDGTFDAVISNSIVHHIPEPLAVMRECRRVLKPGGMLFIRDLLRPHTDGAVDYLVDSYASRESDRQQQLFKQSLHAALTLADVARLLREVNCPEDWVTQTSDRHWTVAGVLV